MNKELLYKHLDNYLSKENLDNDLNDSKGIKGITEEMNHYIQLARMRRNNYSIVEDITLDKSAKIIKYNDVIPEYMKNVGKIDKWDKEEMLLYDNYYDIFEIKINSFFVEHYT